MLQKTKREIIEETVAAYNYNSRAISNMGHCVIQTNDGRKCAVGRCMTDAAALALINTTGPEHDFDEYLKPEYHGHNWKFWRDLQTLHDDPIHWLPTGISGSGEEFVNALNKKWL